MNRIKTFWRYLWRFAVINAISCVFALSVFVTLAVTQFVDVPFIARYDLILIVLVLVQVILVWRKWETVDELKVIMLFHVIGLALEIFKVNIGSWTYPEDAITKIAGVPLYSGFMYSSVASYIVAAWKRFRIDTIRWPSNWLTFSILALLYANFFTQHFFVDLRWWLLAIFFVIFIRTWFTFRIYDKRFKIPAVVAFMLISFFIWMAENISTFFNAWQYPDQAERWTIVGFGKISSWFIMVAIQVVLVANLKRIKAGQKNATRPRSTGQVSTKHIPY